MWKQIMVLLFIPLSAGAQYKGATVNLTLEESYRLMNKGNQTLKIAREQIGMAREERQILNSSWYPSLDASGAYVHLANDIEVKEPLSQFTDPAKDFVHTILPDDKLISSILTQIGSYSLSFPLLKQNLTTVDAFLVWPVFTGGQRIFANKIGRSMERLAEVNMEQTGATLQASLVESYYAVRLAKKVVQVREETFSALQKHFQDALKLQENGMITKAEKLVVQVNRDEAKRELESARKDYNVAQQALCTLLNIEQPVDILAVSPLFMNEELPSEAYFKELISVESYPVEQLYHQTELLKNQQRINRSAYVPNIALFGKQTLYAKNLPKNLMPRTMIGIGFTWTLFDGWKREATIRQTERSLESLALGREKAINELSVLVEKLYSEMLNAQDNVTALNTTIAMSRELVRIRRKSFQEGMATSTEVIDAETMLSKVQIAFLLAYYQYDVALANLLTACGMPDSFWQYARQGKTEDFIFESK